ncbi:MAG: hypothetical protein HVN35_11160 [Methanobacteriaceae archaeon]|nr:hypothetical protein [Methanobacteriaceae archaeon]
MAYAAFESAVISLTDKINGKDYYSHSSRKKRAKELLSNHKDEMDLLWEVRNVDFYSNVKLGSPKREISPHEVKKSLESVKEIIRGIEEIINKKT